MVRMGWIFVVATCFATTARAARIDPLLPDSSATVVFVNVRQMVDLPVAKPHAEAMLDFVLRLGPEMRQGLEALGVRPLEDVDTLTIAIEKGDRRTLIVHGRFNPETIQEAVESLAKKEPGRVRRVKVDEVHVYEQRVGRSTFYSAVVDERTLLFSPGRDRAAFAAGGNAGPARLSERMQELIGAMNDEQSVWAAFGEPRELLDGILQKLFNPLGLPLLIKPRLLVNLEKPVQRVGAVTCSVGIGEEIRLTGSLQTGKKETAALLAAVLSERKPLQLLVIANPLLGRDRGEALASVIGDATVEADDADVSFSATFANETLRRVMTAQKP